jgi:hypothetical protein
MEARQSHRRHIFVESSLFLKFSKIYCARKDAKTDNGHGANPMNCLLEEGHNRVLASLQTAD